MNARGERILIFGDSLTQHAGGANQVWEVNSGANRSSSAPGDLLASMLFDQGAAVRTDALVSRSAYNFWTREPAADLIAHDLAWRPTKIVFVLGTNDVGLAQGPDQAAFRRLVDAYTPSKAEMWAIGPFTNRQTSGTPQAQELVVQTMKKIFGRRFIDGRPISKLISPGSDGIHYTPTSARLLALNMADALLSTSANGAWWGLAAAAIVIGGALAWAVFAKPRRSLAGLEIVDGRRYDGPTNALIRGGYRPAPCKSGLDRVARCWTRGRGLGRLAAPADERAALMTVIAELKTDARGRSVPPDELITRARNAGVTLVREQFDLEDQADTRRFKKLYKLTPKQVAAARRSGKIYEVATTPDGYVVDWMAPKLFDKPTPFVYKLDRTPKIAPAPVAPRVTRLPANKAALVAKAAKAVPKRERFGDDRVFISDVHAQLAPLGVNISLADFKRELVRMLQKGDVLIVRADLVGAMDPQKVEASETQDMGSEWHFVALPEPQRKLDGVRGATLPPGAAFLIEQAAEDVPRGRRFGGRKVFISDVYEQVRRRGVEISPEDFKRELVRMHRDKNVVLARADLVAAMDPDVVAASETKAHGADFHMVVLPT